MSKDEVTLILKEYGSDTKKLEIQIEPWAVETVTDLALDLLRISIKGRISATIDIRKEIDLDERIKKEGSESKQSTSPTGPVSKPVLIAGPASSSMKQSGSSKDGNAKSRGTSASSVTE